MVFNRKEFVEPVRDALYRVQALFDKYQKEKFPNRTPEFFCLELCGETGELANLQKKRWKGKEIPDEMIADEMADVLIALLNFSNVSNIDLADAVVEKIQKIEEKRKEMEERGEEY